MKHSFNIVFLSFALLMCGCHKRKFFEDQNNQGLSRLTSRNYNVTSAYINGQPWVSSFSSLQGPAPAFIYLAAGNTKDTLYITWRGAFSNETVFPSATWRLYDHLRVS